MNLPTDLGHVRVVLARYPDAERVDVIDVRSGNGLATLLSLDPADAVQLAHHLFQVAGWVEPSSSLPR